MAEDTTRFLIYVFSFAIIVAFSAIAPAINSSYNSHLDFKAYLTGANLLYYESENLYEISVQKQTQFSIAGKKIKFLPYRSPPPMAVFYLPFLLFQHSQAYLIYVFVAFTSLILINLYFAKKLELDNYLFVFLFTALFVPNLLGIYNGQPIYLIYGVFVLIYVFLLGKDSYMTGLVSGLLFLKPQFFTTIPFLLLLQKEKQKYLKGLLYSTILLLLVSTALSRDFLYGYVDLIVSTENEMYGSELYNMLSLSGFLSRYITGHVAYFFNVIAYMFFLGLFAITRRSRKLDVNYTLIIISSILFGVHIWKHDLVLLQIPLLLFYKQYEGKYKYPILLSLLLVGFVFLSTKMRFFTAILLSLISFYLFFKVKIKGKATSLLE